MTGRRSSRWRAIRDSIGRWICAIEPFGLRTATAQFDGPRIITPSRTAWPPTVVTRAPRRRRLPPGRARLSRRLTPPAARCSPGPYYSYCSLRPRAATGARGTRVRTKEPLAAARAAGLLEAPLDALHPAAGVDELLLARVERVALGADLDVQLGLRRARLERIPAGARHRRDLVLGVNAGLHRSARIAAAVRGATLPPETTAATV